MKKKTATAGEVVQFYKRTSPLAVFVRRGAFPHFSSRAPVGKINVKRVVLYIAKCKRIQHNIGKYSLRPMLTLMQVAL